jgi:hypothetical protein
LTDIDLSRWKSFSHDDFSSSGLLRTLVPGEEVSCLNSNGNVIHLCCLGIKNFIFGSADGVRKKPLSTLKLQEVIQNIHRQGGLAVAAHPGSKFGILQRVILNRGSWLEKDIANQIDAVQAVNNGFDKSWKKAKSLWIKELLKGRKLSLVAGNDSHGDFNRYRYISVPFFLIAENFNRYLSCCKTGIYRKTNNKDEIISDIRHGKTFVTNGPFICLSCSESIDNNAISDITLSPVPEDIIAIIKSSFEFGRPYLLQVFFGKYSDKKESIVFSKAYKENTFSICTPITIKNIKSYSPGYIRAELTCRTENGNFTFAATSPCYL